MSVIIKKYPIEIALWIVLNYRRQRLVIYLYLEFQILTFKINREWLRQPLRESIILSNNPVISHSNGCVINSTVSLLIVI